MAVTTTQRNAYNSCHTTLKTSLTSGTQTTGIILNALVRNGSTVSWPATGGGVLRFYRGGSEEHMAYVSATVDGTTKDVTLVTVTRDLPWNDGTSYTSAANGIAWPAGTAVDLVLDARHMNAAAFQDLANTFTNDNTLATTKKFYLGDTGNYITGVAAGDLSLRSNTTASTTLAQLAAGGGTDHKVLNTINDTTASYLASKLSAGTGITLTTLNPAGNETTEVKLTNPVTVATGGTGIATTTAYGVILGGTTATGAFQNAGAGSTSQFLRSNGASAVPSFADLQDTDKTFYVSGANSTNTASFHSSTAQINFDTHTRTISANDLIAGVVYEIEGLVVWTPASTYDFVITIRLGTTDFTGLTITAASGVEQRTKIHGRFFGTAAAGASVAVNSDCTFISILPVVKAAANYVNANVATNGSLLLQVSGQYGTSNAANDAVLRDVRISRFSATYS